MPNGPTNPAVTRSLTPLPSRLDDWTFLLLKSVQYSFVVPETAVTVMDTASEQLFTLSDSPETASTQAP